VRGEAEARLERRARRLLERDRRGVGSGQADCRLQHAQEELVEVERAVEGGQLSGSNGVLLCALDRAPHQAVGVDVRGPLFLPAGPLATARLGRGHTQSQEGDDGHAQQHRREHAGSEDEHEHRRVQSSPPSRTTIRHRKLA
jgi:hypothetical protein